MAEHGSPVPRAMTIWLFHREWVLRIAVWIHQHFVVVLDQADLRRRLDGNGLAQLQVVDLFSKRFTVSSKSRTTWALMARP